MASESFLCYDRSLVKSRAENDFPSHSFVFKTEMCFIDSDDAANLTALCHQLITSMFRLKTRNVARTFQRNSIADSGNN